MFVVDVMLLVVAAYWFPYVLFVVLLLVCNLLCVAASGCSGLSGFYG